MNINIVRTFVRSPPMTRHFRILVAFSAAWLLCAGGAPIAAARGASEELLAPLASVYMQAVRPGEEAELHLELYREVLQDVQFKYVRDVDVTEFVAAAIAEIEPLEPHAGDPAEVFKRSINAALASLDPHSRYIDSQSHSRERSAAFVRETARSESLSWNMQDDVLVLRLSSFTGAIAAAIATAVADAIATRPPRGIVLDLRGNLGGLFREAVKTADAFLGGGEIGSLEGRSYTRRTWRADAVQLLGGVPMVVLVDQHSASAAELVAAALQDNGRATILGQRSNGKGSVQDTIALGRDRGVLRLTTTLYYGPSGRLLQRTGIGPDIELVHAPETTAEAGRREADRPRALPGADEPLPPKARVEQSHCATARANTDVALACALAFLEAGDIAAFLMSLETVNADAH